VTEHGEGGRSALVLGATGLIGGHCVDLLLADPGSSRARVLVRRPFPRSHERLEAHVLDLDRMEDHPELFRVDHVFCALGTTIRKAGSRAAFNRVDVEYPITAARLAAEAGARGFVVVSAVGADPESRVAYNRSKGEMERGVRAAALPVWILRPSLLLGEREENRPAESIAQRVLAPLSPLLIGPLRRYGPVHGRTVARAMLRVAGLGGAGGVVESEEIPKVAGAGEGG
jgi:uncharacterized protein YbjT (DUF2867 family)